MLVLKMSSTDLVQRSFKYHLIIMKIFGLYPFDSYPEIYKPYSFFLFVIFTIATPILPLVYLITAKETDVDAITENGFMIIQLVVQIAKLLPCKINPEGMKRAVYALNKSIFNSYTPEQSYIVNDIVNTNRYILLVCVTFTSLAVASWATLPLISKGRTYPFDIWLPFDPFENTAVYLAVYLYIFLGVGNSALDSVILDTLVDSLIYHAVGQLRVLKDTIQHLNQRVEDQILKEAGEMSVDEKKNLKTSIIYKKICHCIDHYDAIFEFVSDLENTYSFTIFSQFIASIVVICICCFQLSVVKPFTVPFFSTITCTTALLTEIFLFCYAGTLLYEESDTVNTAIYLSEWYTYDKKSKKALFILMERAKRPITITAGKLLDLSLETFTTIIRKSYSLLAVLKNY